jgi:hypothetical protein
MALNAFLFSADEACVCCLLIGKRAIDKPSSKKCNRLAKDLAMNMAVHTMHGFLLQRLPNECPVTKFLCDTSASNDRHERHAHQNTCSF